MFGIPLVGATTGISISLETFLQGMAGNLIVDGVIGTDFPDGPKFARRTSARYP